MKNLPIRRLGGLFTGTLMIVFAALGQQASAAPGPFPGPMQARLCDEAIATAEREHRIPRGLLKAIALKETGRWDAQASASYAWPWTVTNGAAGKYLPTIAAAMHHVNNLKARGETNIDVGCMQVNLRYHGDAFADLEDAFDPRSNADYAASFLADLRRRHGSWTDAVEHYHSGDADRGRRYREAVYDLRDRVRGIQHAAREPRAPAPGPTPELKAHLARKAHLDAQFTAAAATRKADLERLNREREETEARLRAEFEARKAKVMAAWKEKMAERQRQRLASAD